jgi:hypothetical protein
MMDCPGSLEQPVVAGAEIVGPGLDGASEVEHIERLEPRFIIAARPLLDFGRDPAESAREPARRSGR